MNKLIAFGDSFTWGSELRDVVSNHDTNASNYTWPALLANTHKLDYVCLARPGASNQTILRTILSNLSSIHINDLVVVNWTWINRWDFYNLLDEKWETLRPASNIQTLFDQHYFKYFQSELWDKLENLKSINLIHSILKQRGVKMLITSIDSLLVDTKYHAPNYIAVLQEQIKDDIIYFNHSGFYDWAIQNKYQIGADGHPLEQAHREAFNYINEHYEFTR